MAKAKPDPERTEDMDRLIELVDYAIKNLGVGNQSALARKLGVKRATLSLAKSRGVSGDVKRATHRVLGVQPRYWDSPVRLDPADCIVRRSHGEDRERCLEIAKARGASKWMLGEIGALTPPADADGWYWFATYLRLVDEETARTRKAS